MEIGTKIEATAKSKHVGQTGTVVADYLNMLMVKADDESYPLSFKNKIGDGKYFQVDSRAVKVLKD